MLSTQHTSDIISKFETYVDDQSEISSQEELELCNKIYQGICNLRPWEFLKKAATGTVSLVAGVYQISAPSDFKYFSENNQMTDNNFEIDNNMESKVVYISTTTGIYKPYQVVNFSDRRKYLNMNGFCYYDPQQKKIIFTGSLASLSDLSYEFDYIMRPPDLKSDGTSDPLFPSEYWDAIYHGMAVDDQIIQLFERAHSYMKENEAAYEKHLRDLEYYNANQILN